MTRVAVAVVALSSLALFLYGLNLLWMSVLALRLPRCRDHRQAPPVPVLVQVPVYNEVHVAERVVEAVARLDWHAGLLEIQILDDSDDATSGIVAAAARLWRARGVNIAHLRRGTREGFKAGALAHGLALSEAPFVAVFDADFVPAPDFLRRTMGWFGDERVAFVQARWGHLDRGYSLFTRLQSLAIDFHFAVEQAVRPARGWFTNFSGTAGVWRRAAIEDAGGWSARTLTEDLDLSYRAQLRGWRGVSLPDTVVPEEIPVSVGGYRSQQTRWATGSFQTAAMLLPGVWGARVSLMTRLQASVHLLAYLAPVLMLIQIACYPALVFARLNGDPIYGFLRALLLLNLTAFAPAVGYVIAQSRVGARWWRSVPMALCVLALGAGNSLTVLRALWNSRHRGGAFHRTPKFQMGDEGEWRSSGYAPAFDRASLVDLGAAAACAMLVGLCLSGGTPLLALYASLFCAGFAYMGGLGLVQSFQVMAFRRLGSRTLKIARGAAPYLLALSVPALALALMLRLPDPFEDSYQHWLMAATLATTGHLRDPLFGMENTWLPGYGLWGGALLRIFGTWQLGVLRASGAVLGMATLILLHRAAGGGSRGRLAMVLAGLNPVFLLTSTQAVAEPLLTVLLTGAAAAWIATRRALAACLLLAACLVGTKAWLWVALMLAALVLQSLMARRPARQRWLIPAAAAALALQFGFGYAGNSLAHATREVVSAVARGSIPASPALRTWDLIYFFGLAALPLAALAPFGLAREARRRALPALMSLHVPALLYLAAVLALVGAGLYTGSHRYLYVAIPALAVLAASAVDGRRVATALALCASAGMALAYVPVFAGLAHVDDGLRAAGAAVRPAGGALLTDSPVAAYWSGVSPARIYGSESLPDDGLAALQFMRAHGVRALVLENIDYYRAASVLPQLVRGESVAPYIPVTGAFTVGGGKDVHVYRLPPATTSFQVTPRLGLDLNAGPDMGKISPLARGVALTAGGVPVSGEGAGFGLPIAHDAQGWHYPGTALRADMSTASAHHWRVRYDLSLIGGDRAHDYQFAGARSPGTVSVDYMLTGSTLQISADWTGLGAGVDAVMLLNEQGAQFDDVAYAGTALQGAAIPRWALVSGPWARWRSATAQAEWEAPSPPAGAVLYAGRELADNLDWAGLDYRLPASMRMFSYGIWIQAAR